MKEKTQDILLRTILNNNQVKYLYNGKIQIKYLSCIEQLKCYYSFLKYSFLK